MSSKLLAGRYELIEKIGDGGMAVVYKAKDRLLNRYVAIKILRPEFTKDAQFIESFKKESQAAAGLQHPNIVNVYDVGKDGNIYFIVMELIDGRPLSEVIEENAPLDYKTVIEIGKQVAAALSLAHKNHIIHRDVKPHNIMITKDGTAKLADFGIAKAVSNSTIINKDEGGQIMGSVHYFSPEQARGKYVDEKSDVYSLGIVLYEMLTGQVPFDGENAVQIALMHMNDEIKPPSQLVGGVPPALEKIILKATDKYQNNRYSNADELYEELSGVDFLSKRVGDSVLLGSKKPPVKIDDEDENQLEELFNKKTPKKKAKKPKDKEEGKKSKWWIPTLIVLVLLLVGGGVYGALSSGVFKTVKEKEVEVPDLTGMTYSEAQNELKKIKLVIKKGDLVPSSDIEKDKIVSQDPIKNSKVKEGSKVTVNISKGKESGAIPNLVGKKYTSFDDINKSLSQYGFKLGEVTKAESDKYEEGIIASQSPEGGATMEEGTVVNIVVSTGRTYKVPTLTGLTADQAMKAIKDAGFQPGEVKYEESAVYGKDYVMWQEYSAGTELKKGTSISIKISKGTPVIPETPTDPEENPKP